MLPKVKPTSAAEVRKKGTEFIFIYLNSVDDIIHGIDINSVESVPQEEGVEGNLGSPFFYLLHYGIWLST